MRHPTRHEERRAARKGAAAPGCGTPDGSGGRCETAGSRRIRVVIADGREFSRRMLIRLLETEPDMRIVGTAADVAEAADVLRRRAVDVVALDAGLIRPPQAVAGALGARDGHPAVIVVGMDPERAFAEDAHRRGAAAYVRKDRADVELAEAVRSAAGRDSL